MKTTLFAAAAAAALGTAGMAQTPGSGQTDPTGQMTDDAEMTEDMDMQNEADPMAEDRPGPTPTQGTTTTEQSPDTEETSVYDGPDSYNPNQPPPTEGGITRSVAGPYRPVTREDYPRCSATVRDNCIQQAPPG